CGTDKYDDAFLGFRQIRLDSFWTMGLVSNRIPVLPFPGGAARHIEKFSKLPFRQIGLSHFCSYGWGGTGIFMKLNLHLGILPCCYAKRCSGLSTHLSTLGLGFLRHGGSIVRMDD
ncbi:MAG: hypothetical protein HW380_3122, partial [Magnetococcales bacterium]|nr:hypothetical protein [Magnetococcales bacterium]